MFTDRSNTFHTIMTIEYWHKKTNCVLGAISENIWNQKWAVVYRCGTLYFPKKLHTGKQNQHIIILLHSPLRSEPKSTNHNFIFMPQKKVLKLYKDENDTIYALLLWLGLTLYLLLTKNQSPAHCCCK